MLRRNLGGGSTGLENTCEDIGVSMSLEGLNRPTHLSREAVTESGVRMNTCGGVERSTLCDITGENELNKTVGIEVLVVVVVVEETRIEKHLGAEETKGAWWKRPCLRCGQERSRSRRGLQQL